MNKIYNIYKELYTSYGPQGWWPFLDVKDNIEARKQITELYFAEKPSLEKFRDKFTDEDGLLNYNLSKQLFDSAKRYLRVAGRIDETITFRNASAYIEKNKLEKEWKKEALEKGRLHPKSVALEPEVDAKSAYYDKTKK